MALKAGYNGIKKSVLDKLLQMSGALIIKSLGTALSLSDAGELRVRNASDSHSGVVQPDGVSTYIEGGLLKAAASSSDYVLNTEVDTGRKWIDGKTIYSILTPIFKNGNVNSEDGWAAGGTGFYSNTTLFSGVDTIIQARICNRNATSTTGLASAVVNFTNATATFGGVNFTVPGDGYLYCEYTKETV